MTDYPVNENDGIGEPVNDVIESASGEDELHTGAEKNGFFELVYGTLFKPVGTFMKIANNPPVFYGFVIFISVILLTSLANVLLPQDLGEIPPELAEAAAHAGPSLIIVGAIMSMVFWVIQAGVLQVISELLGGRGKAVGVLTVLALSSIPSIFVVPFRVASYFLTDSFMGIFLSIAGTLIAFVWWIVLLVLGLREIQRFSTSKAIAAVIAPLVGIVLIVIVTVVSLFAMTAQIINGLQ